MSDNFKKNITPQWIFNILVMLLIASMSYIFNSSIRKIDDNANKIENVSKELNPVLTEIKTQISKTQTDVSWIKESIKNK